MKKLAMIFIPLTLVMLLSAGCTLATPEVSSPTPKPAVTAPSPTSESPVTSSSPTPEPAVTAPPPISQSPATSSSPILKPSPIAPSPIQKPILTSDLSPGTGMIEVYVTDPPPPDVQEVWVDIETLEVHKTGGNWTSINVTDTGPFPLISLANNNIEEFLGSQIVEVGKYTQIRLGLGSVMIEADGANHTAKVPSGKIKLVGNFNVTENNTTGITLDFNGKQSVIETGKGEYIFKPVIKLDVSDKGQPPTAESGADLQISKSDSPDPVFTGDNITYTLEVENLGPDDATGVTVTDNLTLAEVTYQSYETDNGTASYNETSGIFTWDIGDLAVGAIANLTIEVQAPLSSGDITNTVTVSGSETDPDPTNNSASENTTVTAKADLGITKSDDSDPVTAGDNITYTLTVTNSGPDDATGITVTDNLTSANVTYLGPQSFNTDNGTASYNETSGIFTWNIGDLDIGATANLTIEVQAPSSSGDITNTADVMGSEADPILTNNSASENTTVNGG